MIANNQIKEFVVGPYQILKGQRLGEGSYGNVYKAIHIQTKFKVAVKEFKVAMKNEQKTFREIQILQSMQSRNIVRYLSFHSDEKNDYLFFQLCDSNLTNHIKKISKPDQPLKGETILEFFKQICNGFKVLYQNKIIHRDIKPENILVLDGVYKIADFGFAREIKNLEEAGELTGCGTPMYVSPQISSKQSYCSKCDVWSFGVILYQLMSYENPFGMKAIEDMRKIFPHKALKPSSIQRKPLKSLEALVVKMLEKEQGKRISWYDIFLDDLVRSKVEHDLATQQAVQITERALKFYEKIYKFEFKTYSLLKNSSEIENILLDQKVFHSCKLQLLLSSIHYCRKLDGFLFQKQSPHPMIDNESWRIYKTTDNYWVMVKQTTQRMAEILQKIQRLQQTLRLLVKKQSTNSIDTSARMLCEARIDSEYDQEMYFSILNDSMNNIREGTSIPHDTLLSLQKSISPLKSFNIYDKETKQEH